MGSSTYVPTEEELRADKEKREKEEQNKQHDEIIKELDAELAQPVKTKEGV